jgi:hypothetical protein
MPYDHISHSFIDPRPAFETVDRNNMMHPVMKLDHRIPWNLLKGTLNKLLAGNLNIAIINSLLKLSPSADKTKMITNFKTAVGEGKKGRVPPAHQLLALNVVEQEIFSLPCNLALGLNERADDPGGDNLDYTPDDVDHAGAYMPGLPGQRQALFETLYGLLSVTNIGLDAVDSCCNELRTAWQKHLGLDTATPAKIGNWHPGPLPPAPAAAPARTNPPYRYWVKPTGAALTSGEIQTMIGIVTARAKKYGGKR